MTREYVLTLSERQAQDLVLALDAVVRLGIGQLKIIDELVQSRHIARYDDNQAMWLGEARDKFREQLAGLSALLGYPAHTSLGVGHQSVHPAIHRLTDLHDVLRHAVSWAREPGGGFTVNFDEPVHYGDEPLPTVEVR